MSNTVSVDQPARPIRFSPGRLAAAIGSRAASREGAAIALIVLALAALGFECWRYLRCGAYVDHIEDAVMLVTARYMHGAPLYDLAGGIPRLTSFYGPLAYLLEAVPLWLFGPSVIAGKLLSLLAMLATLGVLTLHWRRRASAEVRRYALLFFAAGLLVFSPVGFWVRPDPFELLAVAAAVATTSPWCVGLCIGVAVNLKVHAFIYFLPLIVDHCCRGGWRALLRLAVAAGIVFLLPFAVPGISLHDYAAILRQQLGGRAWSPWQAAATAIYMIVLVPPVAVPLLANARPWRERLYPCVSLATLALLLYAAMFPGAGPYHFLPLLPVLVEARSRLRPQGPGSEFDLLPLVAAGLYSVWVVLGNFAAVRDFGSIAGEALAIAESSPGRSVQVGYGKSKKGYGRSQMSRVVLALNGYEPRYDAQLLMEMQRSGIDVSRRWAADLDGCRTDRWLLPKGEPPFRVVSFFYDDEPLYSDAFRRAFARNYRRVAQTANFDIWDCAVGPKRG